MTKVWDYKNLYNARNKAIIAMLFETSIKNLEVYNLRVNDVRDTVIKVLGKGNKERYLPMNPALKKVLLWTQGKPSLIPVFETLSRRDKISIKLKFGSSL